ncbi:cell division suppressor protein YneA [Brevibacillus ginsengisoli]|uniref:cell division suppressor protein YneA n=1 Tax=Brevibacillus ginsengisoli TaxID=363854 RepID=UPI003CE7B2E3
MTNTTLYYQPIRKLDDKPKTKEKLGITRGQAAILIFVAGALFLFLSGVFTTEVKADETTYQIITVQEGDNLWKIAQSTVHSPDTDLRDLVEEIMALNHLTDETLYPGQNLQIPGRTNK